MTSAATVTTTNPSTSTVTRQKRRQKKSTSSIGTAPSISKEVLPETPSTPRKSRKAPVVQTPAPEPVVVKTEPETSTTETGTATTDELKTQLDEMIEIFNERLKADREFYRGLLGIRRDYNKRMASMRRQIENGGRRKRRSPRPSDKPGAFDLPCNVSPSLAKFMGLSKEQTATRREINGAIRQYIKDNNLYDNEDKRVFNVDAKLKSVLGEPVHTYTLTKKGNTVSEPKNGYSYFNLQRYLKDHVSTVKNDEGSS